MACRLSRYQLQITGCTAYNLICPPCLSLVSPRLRDLLLPLCGPPHTVYCRSRRPTIAMTFYSTSYWKTIRAQRCGLGNCCMKGLPIGVVFGWFLSMIFSQQLLVYVEWSRVLKSSVLSLPQTPTLTSSAEIRISWSATFSSS